MIIKSAIFYFLVGVFCLSVNNIQADDGRIDNIKHYNGFNIEKKYSRLFERCLNNIESNSKYYKKEIKNKKYILIETCGAAFINYEYYFISYHEDGRITIETNFTSDNNGYKQYRINSKDALFNKLSTINSDKLEDYISDTILDGSCYFSTIKLDDNTRKYFVYSAYFDGGIQNAGLNKELTDLIGHVIRYIHVTRNHKLNKSISTQNSIDEIK